MPDARLNFRSSHNNNVFIEPTKIRANGGIEYPRLIIPIRFDLNPLKERDTEEKQYVIMNIHCSLLLKEQNTHLKISDSLGINHLYKVSTPDTYTVYDLEFPLNVNRITRIEKERRGNLNFLLDLRLIVGIYEQKYLTDFENPFVQIEMEVPQSYWIEKILPALSYGEFFIIEIPKGNKIIQDAWNYIETAEKCYMMWDTKGAYANCREAGKLLDKTVKEKIGNKPSIKKWQRFIDRFNKAASLDLHVEEIKSENPEGAIVITKLETEHLLIITKALLKYAEGLLKEDVT
jgi:hypothetical protein